MAVVQQVANAPPEPMFGIQHVLLILFGLAVFALIVYLIKKKKTENEEARDEYLRTTRFYIQECIKNADNHYFSSWWRFTKNAMVRRIYEISETKKIKEEPLIGNCSYYMGHLTDSNGKIMIAVATGKQFLFIPVVELIEIPEKLMDIQDDGILIRCVGVERKTPSSPYWPIVKHKDGSLIKYGFTMHQQFYDEKVAAAVIEEQGNLFKGAMSRVVQINPKVKISQHGRRIDKGV